VYIQEWKEIDQFDVNNKGEMIDGKEESKKRKADEIEEDPEELRYKEEGQPRGKHVKREADL